jgi:hypothetical protein
MLRTRTRSQAPTKVHYHYVRAAFLTTVLCRPFAEEVFTPPHRPPRTTTDPAQVTCQRCLHKMADLPAPALEEA